jgi:hypothetical protein
VPNLQHYVPSPRQLHQLVGLAMRGRYRLFDKDMDAAANQLAGHAMMRERGRGDDGRVYFAQQIPILRDRPGASLRRDGRTHIRTWINDRHKLDFRQFRGQARVNSPQVAHADDG